MEKSLKTNFTKPVNAGSIGVNSVNNVKFEDLHVSNATSSGIIESYNSTDFISAPEEIIGEFTSEMVNNTGQDYNFTGTSISGDIGNQRANASQVEISKNVGTAGTSISGDLGNQKVNASQVEISKNVSSNTPNLTVNITSDPKNFTTNSYNVGVNSNVIGVNKVD